MRIARTVWSWGLTALLLAGCQLGAGTALLTAVDHPEALAPQVSTLFARPGVAPAAQSPSAPPGMLRLTIRWPSGPGRDLTGYHVQLIPDSSTQIVVTVKSNSVPIATGQAIRLAGQATSSLALRVPAGNNLGVLAQAFSASASAPIAQGSVAGVSINQSKVTNLSLTMGSLYTPLITSLSADVARRGDAIVLSSGSSGSLAVPWAAPPAVLFSGDTASQSAAVTVVSSTSLSVVVPAGAVSGPIQVVDDGVSSIGPTTVWIASALSLQAWGSLSWYYYDPVAKATQILLPASQSTFSATPTWILAPGATDSGAPQPVWSSSNPAAGAFESTAGTSNVFVAGTTLLATTSFQATLGTLTADTESNSSSASAEIEGATFALGASTTRIGPATSTNSVVLSPVNTFTDGSTVSLSSLSASDTASLSLSVLTSNANSQPITTLGKQIDLQHESVETITAQSSVNPSLFATASVTLTGYASSNLASGALSNPQGVAVDATGDVFITSGSTIQEVAANGTVTTFASGLSSPEGLSVDSSGNVFVANSNGQTIVKINPQGHQTVVAGTNGSSGFGGDGSGATAAGALLSNPWSVSVDASGDLFISDTFNDRVRMVPAATGTYYGQSMTAGDLYTVAGHNSGTYGGDGGAATSAGLVPFATTTDAAGNLYIADDNSSQNDVRIVNPAGTISTLAVLGVASNNTSRATYGVAVAPWGNVFVTAGNAIDSLTPQGAVVPVAGLPNNNTGMGNGIGTAIGFNVPAALAQDSSGNLWIADSTNNLVRKLVPGP